jgi:metallo-beta-lactamase class B
LLNTESHIDHAGGLAALQEASGAELWASEASAPVLESGGAGEQSAGYVRFLLEIPLLRYPAPRVQHRFTDGATIRLGPIELTAHITPGHTAGCTSWSFPVRDRGRELHVLEVCGLTPPAGLTIGSAATAATIRAEFERTFALLRSLPVDIFLTTHAQKFGRYRKFLARTTAQDPVAPFIDRDGYREYIDESEERLRREVAEHERHH